MIEGIASRSPVRFASRAGRVVLALTTGAFCAVFACFVATVTEALALWQVACIGGTSGFLGSLLASYVWMKR